MPAKDRDFKVLVKDVRLQLGLTQEDFAREIGVSYVTLNRWENGQYKPSKMAKNLFDSYCAKMIKQGKLRLEDRS